MQAVIKLARDNTGVSRQGAQSTDDAELARLSSAVLANLSSARELRIAARHALPRPRGVTTTAETAGPQG